MLNKLSDWVWSRRTHSVVAESQQRATITLRKGNRYRAVIVLSFSEAVVTNDYIAELFRSKGFADVKVSGGWTKRLAEGQWNREDSTQEVDPHFQEITVLA